MLKILTKISKAEDDIRDDRRHMNDYEQGMLDGLAIIKWAIEEAIREN